MNIKIMIGKIMGAGVSLALFHFHILPDQFMISLAFYLIFKAVLFFGDSMSIIDCIAGAYMLLIFLFQIPVVTTIFSIYLIGKGIWSMF